MYANGSKVGKPFLLDSTSSYAEIEGFFRIRVFIHEFSTLFLQLVFRWGDADTKERIGYERNRISKHSTQGVYLVDNLQFICLT